MCKNADENELLRTVLNNSLTPFTFIYLAAM